jgi:hypothetical protein
MRAAVVRNNRFTILSVLTLFLFSLLGVSPSSAAPLLKMSCDYFAKEAFQSEIGGAYPGKVLTAPDCKLPEGTVVSYIWSVPGLSTIRTRSVTVPDNKLGQPIYLSIYGSNPQYESFRIDFSATVLCLLPDFSLSVEGEKLTPKTPVIIRATSADPGVNFTLNNTFSGLTLISKGVWKWEMASSDRQDNHNMVFNIGVTQVKPNCHSTMKHTSVAVGHQFGPLVMAPQVGELIRVGSPIVLKRQAFSPTASVLYKWEVGDQVVSTSSSFTPRISDVYKTVRLYLTVEDSALGLGPLEMRVDTMSGGSGETIYPALPSASPTPTPIASSSPVLNPQVPGQTPDNSGNNPAQSPIPSPSVSQSAKPTTSPSPTANPIPSAKPSSSPKAVVYKSCTSLRLKFKNGVARDSKALSRYKLKTKPVLNRSVYSANARLDTDKDGLVCER